MKKSTLFLTLLFSVSLSHAATDRTFKLVPGPFPGEISTLPLYGKPDVEKIVKGRPVGSVRPLLDNAPRGGYMFLMRLNKSMHNARAKMEKKYGEKLYLSGIEAVDPGTSSPDEFTLRKVRKTAQRGNWDTRYPSGPMKRLYAPAYYVSSGQAPGPNKYAFTRKLEKGLKNFKFYAVFKNETAAYGKVIGEEVVVKFPLKLRTPAWGVTLFNTMMRTRPLVR